MAAERSARRPDGPASPRARARGVAGRLGAALWLAVVWVLLCGQVSPGTVTGGLVVGAALAAIPSPATGPRLRPRPVLLLVELGRLVLDVSRSTGAVALAALRVGSATRAAVVVVPVHSDRDDLAVLAAGWLTLTPGTLVVDIDVEQRELYVHVLPVPRDGVDEIRRNAAQVEQRLTTALGGRTAT